MCIRDRAYAEKELRKKKKAALAGTGKLVSSVAEAGAQGAEWEADGAVVTETQSVAGVSSGQVQVEIAEYTSHSAPVSYTHLSRITHRTKSDINRFTAADRHHHLGIRVVGHIKTAV